MQRAASAGSHNGYVSANRMRHLLYGKPMSLQDGLSYT